MTSSSSSPTTHTESRRRPVTGRTPSSARTTRAARAWCAQNFLSHDTLENMEAVITQFVELLLEIGFVNLELALAPAPDGGGGGSGGGGEGGAKSGAAAARGGAKALMRSSPIGGAHYNVHAKSLECLRACICAGLYPNVARARPGDSDDRGGKGGGKD